MASNISTQLGRVRTDFEVASRQWGTLDLSSIEPATDAFFRIESVVTQWLSDLNRISQPAQARLQQPLRPDQWDRPNPEWDRAHRDYTACTDISAPIEEAFRNFTDRLLSSFPHAPINYGRPCVPAPRSWTPQEIHNKGELFCADYPKVQEIRGDGNCFYTAFTVLYLEHLSKNLSAMEAFISRVASDTIAYKDSLIQLLLAIQENPSALTHKLRDNANVLPFIHYFRHTINASIQTNPAFLDRVHTAMEARTPEDMDPTYEKPIADFIQHHILSMGVNAGELQMQLLCETLDFPITVYYADTHTERAITTPTRQAPPIERFYRDGEHYCILYPSHTRKPDRSWKQLEATNFMNLPSRSCLSPIQNVQLQPQQDKRLRSSCFIGIGSITAFFIPFIYASLIAYRKN